MYVSVSEVEYVCEHMHNYVHVCNRILCNGHISNRYIMYYINPLWDM